MLKYWALLGLDETSKQAHKDRWDDVLESLQDGRLPTTEVLDDMISLELGYPDH